MSETTKHPAPPMPENPAQTMRAVMEEVNHSERLHATPDLNEAVIVTTPEKRQIHDITKMHRAALEYLKPARRMGTAHMSDLGSLIEWSNRFKCDTSALFANPDPSKPTLTCIADYHAGGPVDVDSPHGDSSARHCHHRAIYNFPLSDEWKAWMAISGKTLDKDEMGEFIEARAHDVMDPTPAVLASEINEDNPPWENRLIETAQKIQGRFGQLAELLAISRRFQVYEANNLTASTNRDTGEAILEFKSEHRDEKGEKLSIPNLFTIAIPAFLNGDRFRMAVRFRYRKSGSTVKFTMTVYNPEEVFKTAIEEAADLASDETGLPLFIGTPEG